VGEPSARYLVADAATVAPLVRQFDLTATAPGGVARLRELILTLAVRGKLVPQDLSDESASHLLERIQAEKSRLMSTGRIRREKPQPAARNGDRPFDMPPGWRWATAADCCTVITDGDHQAPPKADTGIPFLVIGDVRTGSVGIDGATRLVSKQYFDQLDWSKKPLLGDVLYTTVGSFGIPVPVFQAQDFCFQRHIALFRPGTPDLQKFLALALSSQFVFAQAERGATGIAQKTVPLSTLRGLQLPLPPLAEQARIVARVEELMRLCDALEAKGRLEAEQHARLLSTLLGTLTESASPEELAANWQRVADHFDLLLDRPEAVDALEQTILQLAVRGLLVPQDPNDEPASVLLQRIRAEKVRLSADSGKKLAMSLPFVGADEHRFAPPSGWAWARLDQISQVIVDCPHSTAKFVSAGLLCLDTNSFKGGRLLSHKLRYVDQKTFEQRNARLPPQPGDLVFAREGSVGESIIIPPGILACLGQRVMLFRFSSLVSNKFIRLVVTSPDFLEALMSLHKGIGAKHVNVGAMRSAVVPIPPFAEQLRILLRFADLQEFCTALRQRLAARQVTQGHLADALVEQAAA